jgi:hypothetical protein
MIRNILRAQDVQQVSNYSYTRTLLDGASLYGIAGFDYGMLLEELAAFSSEGLTSPYGQGAPVWGSFAMFSDGVIGESYTMEWDLTGASSPTTYEVLTGALPDGLGLTSVSGNTGRISGTPTVAGTFNFTLRATNEFGSADQAFSITIVSPPAGGGGAYAFIS